MAHLYIYRSRNYGDLEAVIEELSAIYDGNTLLQIYHEAVSEDYGFLYVNFISKDTKNVHDPIRPLLKSKLKCSVLFYYI